MKTILNKLKGWALRLLKSWFLNPLVWVIIVDIILSNIWLLWKDVRSDNPMYEETDGWVDTWVNNLCVKFRFAVLFFGTLISTRLYVLSNKHIAFASVYFVLLLKDAADFISNGNHNTLATDLKVFFIAIVLCEFIFTVVLKPKANGRE